jgi:hypothetical protein
MLETFQRDDAMILAAYAFMLIFDFAVFATFIYLIGWRYWDPWWFLVAIIVMSASNPTKFIHLLR